MADFLTRMCQGPLDGPHLIPVVRGLSLTCFERALRCHGATDEELERFRWIGLEKYRTGPETARYYTETPDLTLAGFRLYLKAFSERFQPFERIMGWAGGQGRWGMAIRIGMEPVAPGRGGDGNGARLLDCTVIAIGFLCWNDTPAEDELNSIRMRLADAWSAAGVVPRVLGADEGGDRPIVGAAWGVEEWKDRTDQFLDLAERLLVAAMAVLKESEGVEPNQPPERRLQEESRMNAAERLANHLALRGYRYSPEQIASFYGALKAKGFVILSGLSGTGKTKLAQEFAKALLPAAGGNLLLEPVRPDWRDSTGLLGYWNPVTRQYEATRFLRHVLAAAADYRGEEGQVSEDGLSDWLRQHLTSIQWATRVRSYREAVQRVQQWRGAWTAEQLSFLWRERDNGIRLVRGELTADDEVLRRATEILTEQPSSMARRIDEALAYLRRTGEPRIQRVQVVRAAAALEPQAVIPMVVRRNLRLAGRVLGLSFTIRREPEAQRWAETESAWRLLNEAIRPVLTQIGENPDDVAVRAAAIELAAKYARQHGATPRGEAEADDDDDVSQSEPYFVVLDEMNLARVEYYLAEVLSVLESGRISEGSDAGFTRGEISLHDQSEQVRLADGTAVPAKLRLPPNLYIVGTVNMDETTFSFSPKVLDRAFTMEFREVDLTGYPPEVALPEAGDALAPALAVLLEDFTRQGQFAWFSKADVAAWASRRRVLIDQLQSLNQTLLEYDLGFGYRVVDEILAFVGGVGESPMADALSEAQAFDAAVMMKVLPKFHGPLHRVEKPLQAVLAWAGEGEDVRYPRTSLKASRMLRQAREAGHTSFS